MSKSLIRKFSMSNNRRKSQDVITASVMKQASLDLPDDAVGAKPGQVKADGSAAMPRHGGAVLRRDVTFQDQDPEEQEAQAAKEKEQKQRSVRRSQSKRIGQAITCPVCVKQFVQPKVLPCDHVICLECIRKFINPKNLASCPICQKEHRVMHGDPSTLPDSEQMARLARTKERLDQKTVTRCAMCQHNLARDNDSQFCHHCNKTYCSLCFKGHIKVLRGQLVDINVQLEEAKQKIKIANETTKSKLVSLEGHADTLLEKLIAQLRADRVAMSQEAKDLEKGNESESLKLESEIARLLQEQNELNQDSSDQEVLAKYTDIQEDFATLMERVREMSSADLELSGSEATHVNPFHIRKLNAPGSRRGSAHNLGAAVGRSDSARKASALGVPKTVRRISATNPPVLMPKLATQGRIKLPLGKKPSAACFCPWNQEVFICLPENKIIEVYNLTGTLLRVIDGDVMDEDSVPMLYPNKVAFSNDTKEIFALDKWKHSLCTIDRKTWHFSSTLCTAGSGPGKLQSPCGICVAPSDGEGDSPFLILIADSGNDRVQVLSGEGKFLRLIGGSIDREGRGKYITQSELSQPEDVAISPDGNTIAVADTGNHRIRLYTISGQRITVVGMKGRNSGQFELPIAVAIHPLGNVMLMFSMGGQFLKGFPGHKGICCINVGKADIVNKAGQTETDDATLIVEARANQVTLLL